MTDREIEALEDEIAGMFAEMFALTAKVFRKVAEFDAAKGWQGMRYQSAAHWLNVRMGIGIGTAREHVRVAMALVKLPLIMESFERGSLSYSKVRAITRIATPSTEAQLVSYALTATGSQMEQIVRMTRKFGAQEACDQAQKRELRMYTDDDGMFVLQVRLMPDEGARVAAAINAQMPKDNRDVSHRRADAFLDAMSSADEAEVVIHVDPEFQQVESNGERISVPAGTSLRCACDASIRRVVHDADGNVLDVGRKTRRISPRMKRALHERDRGCRFPGCPNTRVDAHHIEHWAHGGETKLTNLMSLCRFHHVMMHEGGCYMLDGAFHLPDGRKVSATTQLLDLPLRASVDREHVEPWPSVSWTYRYSDTKRAAQGLIDRLAEERTAATGTSGLIERQAEERAAAT